MILKAILANEEEQVRKLAYFLFNMSKKLKDIFLKENLETLRKTNYPYFIQLISATYQWSAFFPDEEIKQAFQSIGFKKRQMRWFIDLADIVKELDQITEDEQIGMLKVQVLINIKLHFDFKIADEVAKWADFTETVNEKIGVNKLKATLKRMYRRRKYGKGKLRRNKNPLNNYINDIHELFTKMTGSDKEAEKLLLKMSGGHTEGLYLPAIIGCCFLINDIDGLRTDLFYRRFYNLFKKIILDYHFPDENEYYNTQGYVGRNYKSYQALRVRHFLRRVSLVFGSKRAKKASEI